MDSNKIRITSWNCRGLTTAHPFISHLALDFNTHSWDAHIKRVLDRGRKKVHSVISNKDARTLLLLSVVRPTLQYGSEVWEGNKTQAATLELVMLAGAKRILGCL